MKILEVQKPILKQQYINRLNDNIDKRSIKIEMYRRIKTRITFFGLDGTAPKVISRFNRTNCNTKSDLKPIISTTNY